MRLRLPRPRLARFTRPARQIVLLAQAEARALGHPVIAPPHLLIALAAEPAGVAGEALASLGATPSGLRVDVAALGSPSASGRTIDPDALASIGIDLDEVRRRLDEAFGPGALEGGGQSSVASGHIPFAASSKRVLEQALREAVALRHAHIGSEHVLLALVAVEDRAVARLLEARGVAPSRVREAVLERAG
jgi:ATP-dependent Clp protease ATP-binding subunit ClpA